MSDMLDEAKDMRDKVDEMMTTSFTIAGIDIKTFRRFLRYCELNSKATKIFWKDGKREIKEELVYSIAVKQLLDAHEAEAKTQMLFDRLIALEDQLNSLVNQGPSEPKRKTFGRDNNGKRTVKTKDKIEVKDNE